MRTMSGSPCLHYDCSNRNGFGYCKTTVCINEYYQQEQWSRTSNCAENVVVKPQTNADRIWQMSEKELANQLVSEQYVAMKTVLTLLCQKLKDEEILDEKDVKELLCNFENDAKKSWSDMLKEKLEWLKAPVEEEQK